MPTRPILIAGQWKQADVAGTFRADNPSTGQPLPDDYPISKWSDCDAALSAADEAAAQLRQTSPRQIADFLTRYSARIEARAGEIVESAHQETGLPKSPRLADIELSRTTNQIRQASAAALDGSWSLPTIDRKLNIRSCHAALGPIFILGPNNFPLAFNSISGGDFAAAIAAGNPVIAKAHPAHPATTRLLAEECFAAVNDAKLPASTVQLIYQVSPAEGLRLVADPRIGATSFTGSRNGGLKLKSAADAAGKPIYLEMSSLNPVVILPGALRERGEKIADEFTDSCLAATGQFCTNPGLVILIAGEVTDAFVAGVLKRFESRPPGLLLTSAVAHTLETSIAALTRAGASVLAGGAPVPGAVNRFANTLLRVNGDHFLANRHVLQTEAFGNSSLFVVASDVAQAQAIAASLEGNLTACIYSDTLGSDDTAYATIAPELRRRAGRLINDKMPTGVAVSSAMNHGGPFPATGHPGFTAVGIPASLRRFSMLQCFDNVRPERLPFLLRDVKPDARTWRLIDGTWTQADISH